MPLRNPLFKSGRRAGVALAAGVLFATTASAQQQPDLTTLHDALHLTASQEGAWAAYKATVVPAASSQARRQAAAQLFPTLPAPRRIDLVEAEMQEELADLHRQAQALKTFYAVLDTQQQHIFDTQTLPPRGSDRNGGEN
ncbi:MAG TPA: Spy/CpxP family protein refolding chaperone [Caulobacteraceae bacterium]|nr:Spy/CpxP family protein refolding chaperone [Caulobacteraceae bacterium]